MICGIVVKKKLQTFQHGSLYLLSNFATWITNYDETATLPSQLNLHLLPSSSWLEVIKLWFVIKLYNKKRFQQNI